MRNHCIRCCIFWSVSCDSKALQQHFRVKCTYLCSRNCWKCSALCQIQGDQKVTQPILKYLLMVAIQDTLIGLINTQYLSDYVRFHAGHSMLQAAHASLSVVFQQSKCKDVFFASAACVHSRTLPGISFLLNLPEWVRDTFPILLCQTNWLYIIWWTISMTQEVCSTDTILIDLQC
jgi:hypothetical protein